MRGRTAAGLVMLALIAGATAGCGGGGETADQTTTAAGDVVTAPATSPEGTSGTATVKRVTPAADDQEAIRKQAAGLYEEWARASNEKVAEYADALEAAGDADDGPASAAALRKIAGELDRARDQLLGLDVPDDARAPLDALIRSTVAQSLAAEGLAVALEQVDTSRIDNAVSELRTAGAQRVADVRIVRARLGLPPPPPID